jgi:hypothetical protein
VGDVAEGKVTGIAVLAADDVDRPAEGGVRFAVGGQEFTLVHPTRLGGFRLGAVPVSGQLLTPIRPGELLRVTHHDGRILRIEAAREGVGGASGEPGNAPPAPDPDGRVGYDVVP